MLHIRLRQSSTRLDLREWHRHLMSGDGSTTLELEERLVPATPGQQSAWMQLVLTWGQSERNQTLVLCSDVVDRLRAGAEVSDVEVLAIHLAGAIIVDANIATSEIARLGRVRFEERSLLAQISNRRNGVNESVLLDESTLGNQTSLDLHALWDGRPMIEETARTLYHDSWPVHRAAVRKPLLEFHERAVPEDAPTHVARTAYAKGHPMATAQPYKSVSERAPAIRGLALEMATEVRYQKKPVQNEVGEMLFEIAQNTEWHARRVSASRTGSNCRAFSLREYSYSADDIPAAREFDPRFRDYVARVAKLATMHANRPVRRVTLGSVTTIDSGVGLARSIAADRKETHLLASDTEMSYLIAALAKHLKRRRADLGDIGLTRVQQSLTNLHGFMSIRSGTLEIYRDFIERPFEPLPHRASASTSSLITDWIPTDHELFDVGPRVGTSILVVYPVDFELDA